MKEKRIIADSFIQKRINVCGPKKFSKLLDKNSKICYTKYNKRDKETKTMMNTIKYDVLYSNMARSADNACRTLYNLMYIYKHPIAAYKEGRKYNGKKLNFFDLLVLLVYYPFNGKKVNSLSYQYEVEYERLKDACAKLNSMK